MSSGVTQIELAVAFGRGNRKMNWKRGVVVLMQEVSQGQGKVWIRVRQETGWELTHLGFRSKGTHIYQLTGVVQQLVTYTVKMK